MTRCWLYPRTNVQRDEISRLRRRNKLYIFWKLCSWIISWVAVEWYCDIALRKISRSSARINGVSSHEQYRDAKYFTRCSDISHPYVRAIHRVTEYLVSRKRLSPDKLYYEAGYLVHGRTKLFEIKKLKSQQQSSISPPFQYLHSTIIEGKERSEFSKIHFQIYKK